MRVLYGANTDMGRVKAIAGAAVPTASFNTAHFTIGAVPTLGEFGPSVVQALALRCENDRNFLESWFSVSVPHFDIIAAPLSPYFDGQGGAFHQDCSATSLYCDVKIVPTFQPEKTGALAVAEMVEVYEDTQGGGWDCGKSNGEGLSRVLAAALYPGVMDDYAVAAAWLSSYRPDYVNVTGPSDTDTLSVACSVIFLNYLRHVLRYGWDQICRSADATLAGTYQKLTGDRSDPFPHFKAMLDTKYPPGQQIQLTTDNPWT
ncbi:MAG TPA: hypothetical protein VGM17_02540 [Rhizomicrobium sp.]